MVDAWLTPLVAIRRVLIATGTDRHAVAAHDFAPPWRNFGSLAMFEAMRRA
jgi:hypothetical protein